MLFKERKFSYLVLILNDPLSKILSLIIIQKTKNDDEGVEEGRYTTAVKRIVMLLLGRGSVTLESEKSGKKYQILQNMNTLRAAAHSVDQI